MRRSQGAPTPCTSFQKSDLVPLRRHSNGGACGGGAAIHPVLVARYLGNAERADEITILRTLPFRNPAMCVDTWEWNRPTSWCRCSVLQKSHHTSCLRLLVLLTGVHGNNSSSGGGGLGDGSLDDSRPRSGTAMTADGPVPFAGNILDSPDVVWMEDHWTKEEVGSAATPRATNKVARDARRREGREGPAKTLHVATLLFLFHSPIFTPGASVHSG